MAKVYKKPEEMKTLLVKLLKSIGASEENAAIVSDSLVYADMRGVKSHGINMVGAYVERAQHGGLKPDADITVIRESPSSIAIDANNGFGQVGAYKAAKLAIEKAKKTAVACASVKNSNHCGALAFYTDMIAKEGMIGMMFANANPTVAPFGGMQAVIGTNPLSISLPHKNGAILVDMATSTVAKAKIYHAKTVGQKIDPSWAIDQDGYPTDDPVKAIAGVLTPMGGPKGYGLALAVEVFAGVLSGAGIMDELSSVHKSPEKGMNSGCFIVVIDPKAFLSEEDYNLRMQKVISEIKNSKPQPNKTIFLPGEIEDGVMQKAKENGIEYDEALLDSFEELMQN